MYMGVFYGSMQGITGYTVRTHHGKMEFTPENFEKLPIDSDNDIVSDIPSNRYADVRCAIENESPNLDVICKIVQEGNNLIFPTLELAPGVKAIEHNIAPGVVKTEYPKANEQKTIRVRIDEFDHDNVEQTAKEIKEQLEVFGLRASIQEDVFPEHEDEIWTVIAVA